MGISEYSLIFVAGTLALVVCYLLKSLFELKLQHDQLRRHLKHLPLGIIRLDRKDRIIAANEAGRFLLDCHELQEGYYSSAYNLSQCIDRREVTLSALKNPFVRVSRQRKPISNLVVGLKSVKEPTQWLLVNSEPIFSKRGEMSGLLVCVQDFNHAVEQDNIVRDHRAALARAAHFSSAGILAAGVAHEINNPLTIVKGQCDLALRHLNSGDVKKGIDRLQKVDNSIARIVTIIDSLKLISQGDDRLGKTEQVNVVNAVNESLSLCQSRLKKHAITIDIDLPEGLTVNSTTANLVQILQTLLNNAIDSYSESGVEQKKISIATTEHEKGCIDIIVTNNGCNIPDSYRDAIFQPFFTTKDTNKGMGLGLSIARSVVELSGGNLFLKPDDEFTIFVIRLPAGQDANQAV